MDGGLFGVAICIAIKGYQYASGEYDSRALFKKSADEWVVVNRIKGIVPFQMDTENAEMVDPIEINGRSGLCVVKDGKIHIAFADTEKDIIIDIFASKAVSREVVERVAENIVIK